MIIKGKCCGFCHRLLLKANLEVNAFVCHAVMMKLRHRGTVIFLVLSTISYTVVIVPLYFGLICQLHCKKKKSRFISKLILDILKMILNVF